jgi:hypothetical protein
MERISGALTMYKLLKNPLTGQVDTINRLQDNAFIAVGLDNTDYQAYLKWLAEGNTPLPADEPSI